MNYYIEQSNADGAQLAPGAVTPNAAADSRSRVRRRVHQDPRASSSRSRWAGSDRLFVTGAVRTDQNSAFGTDFQRVIYPKVSASWVVVRRNASSPRSAGWISCACAPRSGKSGVQPGSNDALRTYARRSRATAPLDAPVGDLYADRQHDASPREDVGDRGRLRPPPLRPGQTSSSRSTHKNTEDALISAPSPPSAGAATDVRRNLGSVTNNGFERSLNCAGTRPSLGGDRLRRSPMRA